MLKPLRLILWVCAGACLVLGIWLLSVANTPNPISAASLEKHLRTYAASEHNRAAGRGDIASRDWLSAELESAGFSIELQEIPVRHWQHRSAQLVGMGAGAGVDAMTGFPLWYPPSDPASRKVEGVLEPLASAGQGSIAVLFREPELVSKLSDEDLGAIGDAQTRGAVGAVIVTTTISGEPFAYNAWSAELEVPVLILGSRHKADVERHVASKAPVSLNIDGEYRDGTTWNVVGTRKGSRTGSIVVSTPRTGWFKSAAERGPGIAAFVELAKWAPDHSDYDLVFVATGGHELGHAGMDTFLGTAPKPDETELWVHLGASIAAFDWDDPEQRALGADPPVNSDARWVLYSARMAPTVIRQFRGLRYQHSPAFISVFGEARDIDRAGYPRFIAFAGSHPYFHLPGDTIENTSGKILAPAVHAVQRVIKDR